VKHVSRITLVNALVVEYVGRTLVGITLGRTLVERVSRDAVVESLVNTRYSRIPLVSTLSGNISGSRVSGALIGALVENVSRSRW
jgi:hypothetical protein